MQIQRPVKRTIQGREGNTKICNAQFFPDAISPSRSFGQWGNGPSNFIFAVRNLFYLEDDFSLDDVSSCCFMVEKAAQGIVVEGKLVGKQRVAEWMAEQLM